MADRLQRSLRGWLHPTHDDGGGCALDLYRFAAEEAGPEEARAFRAHLAECPRCQKDMELFRQAEPAPARAPTRAPSLAGRWRGWRWLGLALAPAAAAAVLLLLLWRPTGDDAPGTFKVKGGYALQVAVQRGETRFSGESDTAFEDGDVLGFFYTAPEPRFLTLLFADEQGAVTRIFPTEAPARMPAGVELPLPDGAVLEPGQGCEWIVAVFSEEAPAEDALERRLRQAVERRGEGCRLGPLELEGASVDVFVMRRGRP